MLKIILALSVVLSMANCYYFAYPYYVSGNSSNWQKYTATPNGIFIDVDICDLGLTKTPVVTTSLTCTSSCWSVSGVDSIYNLTNKGFRVYIRFNADIGNLTVETALRDNYVLNYVVFPRE